MSAPPDHALLEVGPGPAPPSGAVIQNTAKSLAPGRCLIEDGHGWHPLPLEWGLEGPCRAHVGMNVGWVEVRHVLWGLEHPQWEGWGNSEGGVPLGACAHSLPSARFITRSQRRPCVVATTFWY